MPIAICSTPLHYSPPARQPSPPIAPGRNRSRPPPGGAERLLQMLSPAATLCSAPAPARPPARPTTTRTTPAAATYTLSTRVAAIDPRD